MSELVFVEMPRGGYDVLRLALEVARLPTDDLDGPDRIFFRLSDDREPIGYVGLEGKGADRLLRSLVVLSGRRGQGHGRQLVERLEAVVADEVERLHLLTQRAAPFFHKLGYIDADRSDAPADIAATAQFVSLCPVSAAYLVKSLT